MASVLSSSSSSKIELLNELKDFEGIKLKEEKERATAKTSKKTEQKKKKLSKKKFLVASGGDQCLEALRTEEEEFGEPVPDLYPELSDDIEEDKANHTDFQPETTHSQSSEESQCVPSTMKTCQAKTSDMSDCSQGSQSSVKQRRRKAIAPKKVKKDPSSIPEDSDAQENPDVAKVGSWVQCSKPECCKWRFLKGTVDPGDIPEKWVCPMNTDNNYNDCVASQEAFDSQDEDFDVVYSPYPAGAIVWAKLAGYPWWPAMMEDDPDYGYYYETEPEERVPVSYHVVFFDKDVSRAWVTNYSVREFSADDDPEDIGQIIIRKKNYKNQLDKATEQARQALAYPLEERLSIYGFEKRYKGTKKGKKTKPKNSANEEELLPDSLDLVTESSEEFISSETSYNSSQDIKEKKPKKKTAKIAADKKAVMPKPVSKASDKGKEAVSGQESSAKKTTAKKSQEGVPEKKPKKPRKPKTKSSAPLDSKNNQQSEDNTSIGKDIICLETLSDKTPPQETSPLPNSTVTDAPDASKVSTDVKVKKTANKKGRKRKPTEEIASGGDVPTENHSETNVVSLEQKEQSNKEKPKKKKCNNKECVSMSCVREKEAKKNVVKEKLKPLAKTSTSQASPKKAEQKEIATEKSESKTPPIPTKTVKKPLQKVSKKSEEKTKNSLPKLSPMSAAEIKETKASKLPPKTTETTAKSLPKLVKSTFKPPSKTKSTNAAEGKPRKMPKLVKPQFISPAVGKETERTKIVKPGVVKESQGPNVIVEHLVEINSQEEESSQPIVKRKARKSAIKRIIESDDEEEVALHDEMEAELAKLDKDIKEMTRTVNSPGGRKVVAREDVGIDNCIPTENTTQNNQTSRKPKQLTIQDSPEF